jgi:hypothetical protein
MAWSNNDIGGLSSDDYTLFLKVYGGEVVKAYNKATLVSDKLMSRTIQFGKSATFPTISTEEAKVYTPGADLFGSGGYESSMTNNEKVIAINQTLIATAFIDEVEEMMAHYDVRGPYAEQMGAALATAHDRWSIAAMLSDCTAGTAANGCLQGTAGSWSAANCKAAIQNAAAYFDGQGVPKDGRYVLVTPAMFYTLMDEDDVISSDYNTTGDRGKVGSLWYMGFEILNSAIWDEFNDNPTLETDATDPLYKISLGRGDAYSNTAATDVEALAFHKGAAGTVVLKGFSSTIDWIPERQGHLLVAKAAIGVDVLRTTSIISLKGAA